MHRDAGFSLIEMLMALAVMSLAAGVVVMNAPGPSGRLADETDALIRGLAAARDLALIENRVVTVEINDDGYQTRVASRLAPRPALAPTRWRPGTSVSTDGRLPTLIVFNSVGLAEPATVTLFRDGAKDAVSIDSSGRIGRLGHDSQG